MINLSLSSPRNAHVLFCEGVTKRYLHALSQKYWLAWKKRSTTLYVSQYLLPTMSITKDSTVDFSFNIEKTKIRSSISKPIFRYQISSISGRFCSPYIRRWSDLTLLEYSVQIVNISPHNRSILLKMSFWSNSLIVAAILDIVPLTMAIDIDVMNQWRHSPTKPPSRQIKLRQKLRMIR